MTPAGDLVERTLALCRALRERGLLVTTAHAIDAVRALTSIALEEKRQVYLSLRCVLAARPEDFAAFDEEFELAFSFEGRAYLKPPAHRPDEGPLKAPPQLSVTRWLAQGESADDDGEAPEAVPAASERASLRAKDFDSFGDAELAEIVALARRIARRLAARKGRRWKAARGGARVDLRRTSRRSLSTAATPLQLAFRDRKPKKTRIVALCDVSGSMDLYSRFLLQFLYGLQNALTRVESFVFATELRRISADLQNSAYATALASLSREAAGFSGGTRIGASIEQLTADWPRLVDKRTVVIILSDGWDTGEPETLAEALRDLKKRCRRLIWLNPLLGSPGYQPLAQGMQAALPHLSVFASAHNLASLRALERHLVS